MFSDKIKTLMGKGEDIQDEIIVGRKSYEEAANLLKQFLSIRENYSTEEEMEEVNKLKNDCMKGVKGAKNQLISYLIKTLKKYKFEIEDMTLEETAEKIYKDSWGLSVIEDIYNDQEVDEIEINGINNIYSIRRGKEFQEAVKFDSEKQLLDLITRLFCDYCEVNQGNSKGRTVRADGTRVLATVPPFTSVITVTLRKHNTFRYSKEALNKVGTMEPRIYDMLALFNKGLLNILYSGPTNSGKSSQLRYFFRYSPPNIRTVLLEPRHELKLQEHYPDWNIIEFQEVPKQGLNLLKAFETALQVTPTRIVTGEILGGQEGPEAIKSSRRGHTGNASTLHTEAIEDAMEEIANILVEEGQSKNITMEQALRRACRAFDVVVQLHVPPGSGVKKVIAIGEPVYMDEQVKVINYVEWVPGDENYLQGCWKYENPLSERLIKKLQRNGIPLSRLKEAGLVW